MGCKDEPIGHKEESQCVSGNILTRMCEYHLNFKYLYMLDALACTSLVSDYPTIPNFDAVSEAFFPISDDSVKMTVLRLKYMYLVHLVIMYKYPV